MAGVLAKRKRRGLKAIFDSNELHIESFLNPVKKLLWGLVQKYCVPRCDVIMHAEGNRLEYFKKHHDAGKGTHFLLENFPYSIPRDSLRAKPEKPPVRVLYVGVMGPDRYTRELVDIFRSLAPKYSLDFVGPMSADFRKELDDKLESDPAPNIRILPAIPHGEMSNLIQDYHIGIALYKNDNLCNYFCAPNKVYDYIMNGVPVLANDYPGLLQVLEGDGVGACVEKVEYADFSAALDKIVDENRWDNITEEIRHISVVLTTHTVRLPEERFHPSSN